MELTNGDYRLLEFDKKRKRARICSATGGEIEAGSYPEWSYEKRTELNTNLVDLILKDRARERGYKIVPEDTE